MVFASNILDTKISQMSDRVEIFFNFDTPYTGSIKLNREKDKIKIILEDAKTEDSWLKKIDTPFVYQIALQPKENSSELIVYTIADTAVLAAKSSNGYRLKLTLKKLKQIKQTPKKNSSGYSFLNTLFYIAGSIIIIVLFIFLFFIFASKSRHRIKKKSINIKNEKEKEINIKFEKPLDEHNKIALISFKNINYLVIIGSTNILLGKYKEGEISSEEDFAKLVENTQANIDNLSTKEREKEDVLNELEEYKEKVSKEI